MPHGELTYWAEGSGVPVVAVHGLPGSGRDFRRLGQAAEGLRMIRLNLPGFAGSAPLRQAGDWEALVDTVAQAARTLAGGPFVMLGHSFGGLIALRAAARTREAQGLALLAPAGLRLHRSVRVLPQIGLKALGASRLTRELFFRGLAATPIGARASRAESDVTLALLSSLDYAGSRQAVGTFRGPVFCASCLDDGIVEPEIVEELLATLNVEEHMTFARGGHAPQKDHAAEIAAGLSSFAGACVARASA